MRFHTTKLCTLALALVAMTGTALAANGYGYGSSSDAQMTPGGVVIQPYTVGPQPKQAPSVDTSAIKADITSLKNGVNNSLSRVQAMFNTQQAQIKMLENRLQQLQITMDKALSCVSAGRQWVSSGNLCIDRTQP